MLVAHTNVLDCLPDYSTVCDPRTVRSLHGAVKAVIRGAPLQGTAIGRYAAGPKTSPKHSIKRAHRLLWSTTLEGATEAILTRTVQALLPRDAVQVVVLVDWVELRGSTAALAAGIPLSGRVVPIALSVHANAKRPSAKVHNRFLALLGRVLPPTVRPIIVTDAGFQGTWIASVQRHGWDFVARLRHRTCVRLDDEWVPNKSLHQRATYRAQTLGPATIGKESKAKRVEANLVVARIPPKGRVAKSRKGKRLEGGKSIQISAAAREPWLLATSLDLPAAEVVKIYAQRMKIEQFFRDTKSHAFGRALRQAFTSKPRPLAALFLIAALAHIATMLVGRAVAAANKAKSLQANTADGHLSVHRVGLLVLTACVHLLPSHREFERALRQLRSDLVWRG